MNDIKEKYTCDACRYTFESDKLPDRCPDCGKLQVRRASESEIYEYVRTPCPFFDSNALNYD